MWWLIITLFLWLLTKPFYWHIRGVQCMIPLPIVGNALSSLWVGMIKYYDWLYKSFDGPFAGFHLFTRPALLVKDPALVQEIFIKSHDYFASHGLYINPERDPLGGSVFHLQEDAWKNARTRITPQFTPAKVHKMIKLSDRSLDKLIHALSTKSEADLKSYTTSYTTDFTTTALFGIETDAFNADSDFHRLTKETFAEDSSNVILVGLISPILFDLFKLTSFSRWAHQFISKIIREILAIDSSGANNFVQGIKELKNKGFDEDFIISQATIMYVGGVETTAASLAFCLYELALHPEMQEKVRAEARGETQPGYLDMVIAETLRKYPQFGLLTRKCTKTFKVPNSAVTIEPGTFVTIPAYSIQNDPKYFKNPTKFDPERFSARNKMRITPGTYLPFGLGPRICIGKKFAQIGIKKCVSRLLLHYRFSRSSKTEVPVKLKPNAFVTAPLNGIWLQVNPIRQNLSC